MRSVAFFVFLEAALLVSSSASSCEGDEYETEDWYIKRCKLVGTVDVGIYIMVDTAYGRLLKNIHSDIISYLKVLVNNVEAHFWNFKCPDIKFSLLGVKELTEKEENAFKKYKTFKNESTKKLDPVFTLAMFNRWVNKTNQCERAEVVYLLTSDPIRDFMGAYRLEMKAASYFVGPCIERRTALSTDDGQSFSGVSGMVQQMARLFGIKWDDSRTPTKPCSTDTGYVMTKNGEPTKLANFSCCSYEEWEFYYLYGPRGKNCFNQTHKSIKSENDKLPADFYNASEYCKIFSGREEAKTCSNTVNNPQLRTDLGENAGDAACQLQCCINQTNVNINSPDGKKCGKEKVCIHGFCVSKKIRSTQSNNRASDEPREL
uniref:Putative secreted metalloprotease n=1 Tax=Ixodes ricinus TaxID=34613 RepID=A0A6B0VAX1_IXORI